MKRIICLTLTLCLLMCMVFPASAINDESLSNGENGTQLYEPISSMDLSTGIETHSVFSMASERSGTFGSNGAVSEGWFPDSLQQTYSGSTGGGAPTDNIIGTDGRTLVSSTTSIPYSAICYMEIKWKDNTTSYGTAWMIYSDIAITAGHCVYDSNHGGWAKQIKIWPGKDGYGLWNNPFGTAEALHMHTSTYWTSSADSDHDWGLLELDDTIGDNTGWLGIGWTGYDPSGMNVTISGYPTDHQYYQYKMSGQISSGTTNRLYYTIDAVAGQSGSPIFSSGNVSYGIHCYGTSTMNSGTRITETLFNLFKSYKD